MDIYGLMRIVVPNGSAGYFIAKKHTYLWGMLGEEIII
jgi:hypothetical protein